MSADRIHEETTELYEALHIAGGDPVYDVDDVRKLCTKYISRVRHELDLIKSAVREFGE